jgi:hypothetical protein
VHILHLLLVGYVHVSFNLLSFKFFATLPPEKGYQVEEKRRWAEERLVYYEREGLVLEAEKMRQLIRACDEALMPFSNVTMATSNRYFSK